MIVGALVEHSRFAWYVAATQSPPGAVPAAAAASIVMSVPVSTGAVLSDTVTVKVSVILAESLEPSEATSVTV